MLLELQMLLEYLKVLDLPTKERSELEPPISRIDCSMTTASGSNVKARHHSDPKAFPSSIAQQKRKSGDPAACRSAPEICMCKVEYETVPCLGEPRCRMFLTD